MPHSIECNKEIKIPKNGDQTSCGSLRVINLLSVPRKNILYNILCKVKESVD